MGLSASEELSEVGEIHVGLASENAVAFSGFRKSSGFSGIENTLLDFLGEVIMARKSEDTLKHLEKADQKHSFLDWKAV